VTVAEPPRCCVFPAVRISVDMHNALAIPCAPPATTGVFGISDSPHTNIGLTDSTPGSTLLHDEDVGNRWQNLSARRERDRAARGLSHAEQKKRARRTGRCREDAIIIDVRISHTTVCCRAVALIVLSACGVRVVTAQSSALPLFPVRPLWTIPLGASLAAPPAFDRSRGYLSLDDGRFVAFDLQLGVEIWTETVSTQSQPAVGDDLLFIVEADALSARRASDGTLAWQQLLAEPLAAAPIWDNGWLILAEQSGTVVALRATDGERIWHQSLGAPVSAPPSLAADGVFVPLLDNRVVSLQVETGELRWERRLGGTPSEVLALDDRSYVGSQDNFFYCLRTNSGEVDWRWRTGADVIGKAAVDDNLVYFVSLDNILRGLDRRSGAQRWKRTLPLRASRGPVLTGETLIVGGIGRALPGFSAEGGQPANTVDLPGDVVAAPHTYDAGGVPALVVVTHDIATGASLRAYRRRIEPDIVPVQPLPDVEPVTLPTTS